MARNGAAERELGELHQMLAKFFKDKLAEGVEVDASTLGHIVKFLKDNGIESTPEAVTSDGGKTGQALLDSLIPKGATGPVLPFPLRSVNG